MKLNAAHQKTSRLGGGMLALVLVTLLPACGSKSGAIATEVGPKTAETSNASGAKSSACKSKENCPAASMSFTSSGMSSNLLEGYVNQDVVWEITGFDTADSQRRVVVLLNSFPAGSTINPAIDAGFLADKVRIAWHPNSAQRSSTQKLQIFLRDLDRCEMSEADASVCQEYRRIPDYDQLSEVDWQIIDNGDANGGDAVAPTVPPTPNPGCSTANGDVLGKVIGGVTGIGSLANGDLSGLGGLMDMIGAIGQAASTGVTSC